MFWNIVSGTARFALAINKTVTAIGFAIVVGVAVHDFLGNRKAQNEKLRRDD